MQALSTSPSAAPAGIALSTRQRYRLDTVNMIFKSLGVCGLRIFGRDESVAVLEPKRLGGFFFTPAVVDARPVDLEARVIGRARLLPGFNRTYAEQRLVRCLAAYVIEGRSVPAAMLAQALMADNNQYFDCVEDGFSKVMEEFRFTRAFAKPIAINRKTGPML